ncbi:electron transfer flavoprotein subunit alpha/FixB family protein [Aureimonas altamirensis]|uniref:electron transfer flavoprotein subunit alpha/FixB family protein n=1 Tax=Aureimonas altamirensis TaxID=370622 RepID=UPI0030177227
MTRERKDPRLELARQLVPGTTRPRYDRRGGEATARRRVDPRAEKIAQMVAAAPRLRLDRGQHAGLVSAMPQPGAVEPGAERIVTIENPDVWVLVFADPGDGRLSPVDRQVLGAARQLAGAGGGVALAVEGSPTDAGVAGADRVITLARTAHPEDRARLALALIDAVRPRHVLAAETGDGGDLARRIAAERQQALFAGVEQISARGVVRALPGRRLDQVAEAAPIMTIAPEMILPHGSDRREARPMAISDLPDGRQMAEVIRPQAGSLPLGEAGFVVSAGNGVHDFDLFRQVASLLGGTPGASRVVCDAGLMPRTAQVGASGTVLAADCYLALGIAGAPQHLQGIAGCEHVVAVNTDLHAAMIERAGLAIVADAQPVMEALKRLLEAERQS